MILLALSMSLIPGLWEWDAVPGADFYLFCWSHDPQYWTLLHCVEAPLNSFEDSILDDLYRIHNSGTVVYIIIVGVGFDLVIGDTGGRVLHEAPLLPALTCPGG